MVRQVSSLDSFKNQNDGYDGGAQENRKGLSKSQVKRQQAQSNKKPSKKSMPKALKPKKAKSRKK